MYHFRIITSELHAHRIIIIIIIIVIVRHKQRVAS